MSAGTSEFRDYMQYARECRELATRLSDAEYRRMLEAMADNWAQLAAERKARMRVLAGFRA